MSERYIKSKSDGHWSGERKNKKKEKKGNQTDSYNNAKLWCTGIPFFFANLRISCLLQIVFASKTWETVPAHVKALKEHFLSVLFKSRVDSTVKRCIGNIRAFLKWCRLNNIEVIIPVSAVTAAIYMFQSVQKVNFSSYSRPDLGGIKMALFLWMS